MLPDQTTETQNAARAHECRIRSVIAIVIGVAGYWAPLWYDSKIDVPGDSRIGLVFLGTLPFILGAAIWATLAFKSERRPRRVAAVLLLTAWLPILIAGFGIGLGIVRIFFMSHEILN